MSEIVGVVEGVPEITYEDGAIMMIAQVCDEQSRLSVYVYSYDPTENPVHPIESQIEGKRIRVTIEVIT